MSIVPIGMLQRGADLGMEVPHSCTFSAVDATTLSRTPAASNRKTWTLSLWSKMTNDGGPRYFFSAGTDAGNFMGIGNAANGRLLVARVVGGAANVEVTSTARFRDPAAFYHVVVAVDTTQATAADRVKVFVNGVRLTAFDTTTYPALNADLDVNAAVVHRIGVRPVASEPWDGPVAEVNFIDGQQLDPAEFGGASATHPAVWVAKPYDGSYGANGFRLDFADGADLGKDVGGNGNHWTAANLTASNRAADTPTDVAATFSPINIGGAVLSAGNRTCKGGGSTTWESAVATIGARRGRFYSESRVADLDGGTTKHFNGVFDFADGKIASGDRLGKTDLPGSIVINWGVDPPVLQQNGADIKTFVDTHTLAVGDVVTMAVDLDAAKIWFGVNGSWLDGGDPAAGTGAHAVLTAGGTYAHAVMLYRDARHEALLDSGAWTYAAPAGFGAWSTANLPRPAIDRPGRHFAAVLDTGADIVAALAAARAGWGADYLDIYKNRDSADAWFWRFGADSSNQHTTGDAGASGHNYGATHTIGGTDGFVGYALKIGAASGSYHAAVSHTTGTDTAVTDNLGTDRKVVFLFPRDNATDILVYHPGLAPGSLLILNSANGEAVNAGIKTVTANGFDIDAGLGTRTYDVLVLAERSGLFQLIEYGGNGSMDGPIAWTEGPMAWGVFKRKDGGTFDWYAKDGARSPMNVAAETLKPSSNAAETSVDFDITSVGGKIRSTDLSINASGGTYVGFAFLKAPFGGGRSLPPATAR